MTTKRRVLPLVALLTTAACVLGLVQAIPAAARPHANAGRPDAPGLGVLVPGAAAGSVARSVAATAPLPVVPAPAAGSFTVALPKPAAGQVAAWRPVGSAGLEVAAGTPAAGQSRVGQLAVDVLDRAMVGKLGLSGLVLRLRRTDRVSDPAPVAVKVPADALRGLYGGGYAARVKWVQRPASGSAVQSVVPVAARSAGSTTLEPQVTAQPMLLAATATPSSADGTGTWAATPLRESGQWQVGTQGGDFRWSYPLPSPPAAAGPAPNLALSYDSGSVDGETASTNNQASDLGESWQLDGTGFIERSYRPCALDGKDLTGDQAASGDLCWDGQQDTISFTGHSGTLVPTGTPDEYRVQGDDGSLVRYLPVSSSCADGGHPDGPSSNGGCWQLTSSDGTRYLFGRSAESSWTVPVFGDDDGEPCHQATFADSACAQPWRWNLDYVVDVHGNAEALHYNRDTNYYHRNNGSLQPYIRGGHLTELDYGIPPGGAAIPAAGAGSDRVTFGYDKWGRCTAVNRDATTCGQQDGTSFATPPVPTNYPDVPWDQNCVAGGTCTGLNSPTFWTTQQLNSISTQAMVSGAWTNAGSWQLTHSYVGTGDGTPATLWLSSLKQAGLSDSTNFGPLDEPNRVKFDVYPPLSKPRLNTIVLDSGATINVAYDGPDCDATMLAGINPATNSHQCFPQWWAPPGGSPMLDWFNKYRVHQVAESPGGQSTSPAVVTQYVYPAGPAWRLNLAPGTEDKHRTWSDYAGYRSVEVRAGDPSVPGLLQTTDYQYFQGLDGQPAPTTADPAALRHSSLSAADGAATNVTDSSWFAGRLFETIVRNGANGSATALSSTDPVSDTTTVPWARNSAASLQSIDFADPNGGTTSTGDPKTGMAVVDSSAYLTGDQVSYADSAVSSGGTITLKDGVFGRRVTTTTEHDAYGRVTYSGVKTADAGSTCTHTEYAENTGRWLLDLPARIATAGAECSSTPDYPDDAVSDVRYRYDGAADYAGQQPTLGELTGTDEVVNYDGGTSHTITTSSVPVSGFDALGRQLSSTDVNGVTTTTAYTPAAGGPLTGETVTVQQNDGRAARTDSAGQDQPALAGSPVMVTSTSYDPRWGVPISATDPNGGVTTATYDGLGRRTAVWTPAWPQSAHPDVPAIGYGYVHEVGRALETSTTTLNSRGNAAITSYAFADGLGRPIQTQTAIDGRDATAGVHVATGTIVTDTAYDAAGHAVRVTNPYPTTSVLPSASLFAPSTQTAVPSYVQDSYDALGRPTAAVSYGNIGGQHELWRTSYSYAGTDRTMQVPPLGGTPSATYTDSLGRTTRFDQYPVVGVFQSTKYAYTARGDLHTMTDPAGNAWSWDHDVLGRTIDAHDPDSGDTSSSYDDAGNLVKTVDATGTTLVYGYDALNRKVSEGQQAGSAITPLAAWTYDSAQHGLGQLAGTVSYHGGQSYSSAVASYDPSGKPLQTSLSVPDWAGAGSGTTYSWSSTYDPSGNLATVTDPAAGGLPAEKLTYDYDNQGQLSDEWGLSQYLGFVSYTHLNQPSVMQLTNGSTEIDRAYSYDDNTERLTGLRVTSDADTGYHLAQHAYSYTPSGLLTSDSNTADGQGTDTQCYAYDQLQQVTEAWTPADSNCGTKRSDAALGGPAPYWNSYSYDAKTGNRIGSVQHSTSGSDTRTTYNYPAAGAIQPHALASTTVATGSAESDTWVAEGVASGYSYDAAGRTAARPGQGLSWTAQGNLASVTTSTGAVDDVYDADGNLLISNDTSNGSTLYLGDTEVHATAGAVTATRTYSALGMPVAERSSSGASSLRWLVADPFGQGTATTEVDARASSSVTRRYVDPFGNVRGAAVAWSSPHGFLNHPVSTIAGTVHLGAREYDPVLGRFLSVDPVLDPSQPQQNNGYDYGWNNPIGNADPSGLMVDDPSSNRCDSACSNGVVSDDQNTYDKDPSTRRQEIDTKKVMVTVPNRYYSGGACGRFGTNCNETVQMSLYDLMHRPAGPKNYCGGWSWACTFVGYNQGRNCYESHTASSCFGALLALVNDVLVVSGVGGMIRAGALLEAAATQLGADASSSVIRVEATEESVSAGDLAGAGCGGGSFSPESGVVMAGGAVKPIDQVRVGDKVEATDPTTGKTADQVVTAVWVNHDSDLMDVTVRSGSRVSTVHATQRHLFWDLSTHRWTEAGQLRVGERLRTDAGTVAAVAGRTIVAGAADMWDLTVETTHDFYIATSSANVLVHNCPDYHPRIRQRALDDPSAHNFPYSYDEEILKTDPKVQKDGSLMYRMSGSMNGKEGSFEIAVNPRTGVIFHRFFRPVR